MNDNRYAICGARLGDNNTTGIGFECQAALDKAKENIIKYIEMRLV